MDTDLDVDRICQQIQEKALKATKCSLGIKSCDLSYHCNTSDKLKKVLKHETNECLEMLSSLIQNEYKGKRIERIGSDEDKSDVITELNDNIFDKIGNHLDEASGLKQKAADLVLATMGDQKTINSSATSSWNRTIVRAKRGVNCNLLSAKMVERSQLKFKDKVDNSNHPFVPIIKDKPNSIKPLSILLEKNEFGFDSYSHPYEVEIEKFEPKEHFLQIEIPEIFHGADMDVIWLQRDFGIYLVNLFDTFQASKLLDFSHLSLSYLLRHYCNLEADKHFQLADWRIRPLTPELLKYAREDTHYLIFIYIQMKNQLIASGNSEKNLLKAVFERSKSVCLKLYFAKSYALAYGRSITPAREKPLTKPEDSNKDHSSLAQSFANRVIDLDEQIDSKHDKYAAHSHINTKPLIDQFSDKEFCESQEPVNENLLKKRSHFIDFFTNKSEPKRSKTVENICSSFISQFERYNLTIKRQNNLSQENGEDLSLT
ncbi:unnamed protein product [Oppiella nova]|uniref:3'-5' exonuclease domain-containing protein n=1 Tax=Oppiella nova TaxID=334625 RepID=A0A7R9LGZ2_9ACAR|nr:unnamed protein product [Oppiella nova]CAG2163580.1 unnamed protein product [Oppiella nova]